MHYGSPRVSNHIPLGELIQALRQELVSALKVGATDAVAFSLSDLELEVDVAVAPSPGAGPKVRITVLSTSGDVKDESGKSSVRTHRLKLGLKAIVGEDNVAKARARGDVCAWPVP